MNKNKIILFILMFIIGLFSSYKTGENKKNIISNKEIINEIIDNSFQNKNIIQKIANTTKDKKYLLLEEDYKETIILEKDPIIYLYNSHPTEEYKSSTYGEYLLNPTVIINNYILEDIFNKNGYKAYVEEQSVKNILDINNWSYSNSYKASRIFLEESIKKYPTLKYFIDIHRDSLVKEKTTITIGERTYAKILFIVGLENENYQENLEFTERINQKLDEYYPGLSKGIYKKAGAGVNGVYNQDFSNRVILVEVGGYENTTVEVLNTALAFSKCFLEVINAENN